MEIPILVKTSVPTPTSGNGYLFFDANNANALTVKFNDCSFKVLSAEPYQLNTSQSLLDAQNDFLDTLKCGIKNGTVTTTQLIEVMEAFQLYYSSTIDSNGNLNQSISYNAPALPSDDFAISVLTPSTLGNKIDLAYTSTVGATTATRIVVDRMGSTGDMSVSFSSPNAAITLSGYSYVSNSSGVVITSAQGVISDGTNTFIGEFTYDATAITAGTYTGVIIVSKGSVNHYAAVTIVIS